ncbi:MAG TPA: T6SS immunity protein Tdi1 domain-containing protein [Acidobacteriaceae bacterium]|nr:T6SS immunity protein Tdi1 domain-containing protein [Acidobacteriaceae bacterium]
MGPDLNQLAKEWKWLIDLSGQQLITMSPFGDLLLRNESGDISLLDINLGALEPAASSASDPVLLFPVAFDDRIASSYRKAGLQLTDGKCYGYKTPCVAGGSLEPENVYVATASEYISFMGDFHYQIRDVPDGGSIRLKVINQALAK